jgi:cob(I)alamin adenosyltransferase
MVNLTRIYTRTGDAGRTRLGDMSETSKNDPRLEAYACVDEANAHLGVALAQGNLEADVVAVLTRIQNDLFDVGADLAVPFQVGDDKLRIVQSQVDALEQLCDRFNEHLPPLKSFILPGGTEAAARLHLARTVCRRAEIAALRVSPVNPLAHSYLNRLSDLLFILARTANAGAAEPLWRPGG